MPPTANGRHFVFGLGNSGTTVKPSSSRTHRNAQVPSPQERARICEAIRRAVALEDINRTNSKREARLRMLIGLPPIPRAISWERYYQ